MQLPSKNNLRRRGATLTSQGLRKLNQAKAKVEIEQNFKRYTLEALSEETGLTPNTLSKVFSGSVGVDKRTLECCFDAFNLTLLKDDYLYLKPHQDNKPLAKVELTPQTTSRYAINPPDAGGRNLAPSPPLSFSPFRGDGRGRSLLFTGGLGRGLKQ